jgi:hypothetical protein
VVDDVRIKNGPEQIARGRSVSLYQNEFCKTNQGFSNGVGTPDLLFNKGAHHIGYV